MFDVELRVRAVLRSQVVEFARDVVLPFAPAAWMVLHHDDDPEDGAGDRLVEVFWHTRECRFVCRLMDDLDAAGQFGDDLAGLCCHYESRCWRLVNAGAIRRVHLGEQRQAG